MLDAGRHPNIEILAYSEVESVKGRAGAFTAKVRRKARFINEELCNACGDCMAKCPRKVPDDFDMHLRDRRAVYLYFAQGIPAVATIDKDHCTYFEKGKCRLCERVCQKEAVDFEQKDKILNLSVDAIVVATGLDVFDPTPMTQYGYGRIKNVITGLEYERLINATGPTGGHLYRPSDGTLAKKVAYIQCVGSRDLNYCKHCSSVCCMYAIKDAMLAREHDVEANSHIFHTDFRNVGKWFQEYEQKGKDLYGINYVRGRVGEVQEDKDGNPVVWYEDTQKREVKSLTFDLVVLSVAAMPAKGSEELAKILGIELDDSGFVRVRAGEPADTSRPGIFSCGFCNGPVDIPESVSQASAAAMRVAETILPQVKVASG
ncbi:MAG: CoB--CoM heterodisulfide reductase iron-sulfur subunit A family protein [Candidatus Eiseniibacteriota bacterium]|nr:MAG: CoB--CoM heterodisulfide reductase iron-sulfur subunit A family protein [Candidatus Eisenbacteria bacterium]